METKLSLRCVILRVVELNSAESGLNRPKAKENTIMSVSNAENTMKRQQREPFILKILFFLFILEGVKLKKVALF